MSQRLSEAIDQAKLLNTRLDNILASDSYSPYAARGSSMRIPETSHKFGATFGENITDSARKFASDREPICKWIVYWVAVDVFDNWFKVIDPKKPHDTKLDEGVQKALMKLNNGNGAKETFIRATVFERRYGTSVIMVAYTNSGGWKRSLGSVEDKKILQVTPYPWERVSVEKVDEKTNSLRYGQPTIYQIRRTDQESEKNPSAVYNTTSVHYSKIIHVATRLDESSYEGEPILDGIWDDATGFRNMRWGQYQTLYRYGSGFPHITIPGATKQQIKSWIDSGEFDDLFQRTYFVSGGEDEDIEFKGVQEVTLNPEPYNKLAWDNIAVGTRIPQDILKGATAGTISGSETNERQYWKFISSEQTQYEPMVRELINRLMDTGQINHNYKENPYMIEWGSAFEVNKKDQATVKLLESRADVQKLQYMTINEIRKSKGMDEIEGGDIVPGIEQFKIQAQGPFGGGGGEGETPSGEPPEQTEPEKPTLATRRAERE